MNTDQPLPAVSTVFLIPAPLFEDAVYTLPAEVTDSIKKCRVFFVENERSARRYLKKIWREIVIDDYKWIPIHKAEPGVRNQLIKFIKQQVNIGVISEAGCPGIADPGQILVNTAHREGAIVKPLTGPSSILLAVMASGLNGQHFQFNGYLPIDAKERVTTLKQLESESLRKGCTQVFIETPYRNNQLLQTIARHCAPATQLCIAVDLSSPTEWIKTKTIEQWRKELPDIHKRQAIFCLMQG